MRGHGSELLPAGRVQHCGLKRDSLAPVWRQGHLPLPHGPGLWHSSCCQWQSPSGSQGRLLGKEQSAPLATWPQGYCRPWLLTQAWMSKAQGWMLASGYTTRCYPSNAHEAPLFSGLNSHFS